MDDVKLRKYEHTLAISGAAVVAFGIWSVFKAVIYFVLLPMDQLGVAFEEMDPSQTEDIRQIGLSDRGVGYVAVAGFLIVVAIDLLMRLYIGKHAILDGRRKTKRRVYVGLSIFLSVSLVMEVGNRIASFVNYSTQNMDDFDKLVHAANVSIIIDLTSLLALINLIIAAIMVKKLRR